MKHLKILPDIRTYELLFSLFGNVNAPYEEGNMLSQVDAAKRINAIDPFTDSAPRLALKGVCYHAEGATPFRLGSPR